VTDRCKDSHDLSRDQVPLMDKAIKLLWTLRDNYTTAWMHLLLLERRAATEVSNGVGEEGKQRVSDTILRALRGFKWPPPGPGLNDKVHASYFRVLIMLHGLDVHKEAAEELFLARCPARGKWANADGWAVMSLSRWVWTLLETASEPDARARGEHMALVGRAKEIAARVVPLLGGPWRDQADAEACEVRTAASVWYRRGHR
jgi:hypothetical protein